jgi:hypothetical protein
MQMTYRRILIEEDVVAGIEGALKELTSIYTERHGDVSQTDLEPYRSTRDFLSNRIRELNTLMDRFFTNRFMGETKETENEQLASLDKLLKEMGKEHGAHYSTTDRINAIKHYFEDLRQEKQNAYGLFATLTDDIRVKLLAMQFMVSSVLSSATHREKDTKLGMLEESIEAVTQELQKIDKDRPETYQWYKSRTGSWDYAKALRDLHHQKSRTTELEETLERATSESILLVAEVEALKREVEELREGDQDEDA